jgi:hypothetical protein
VQGDQQYPALNARRDGRIDEHVDRARRELWRAYQAGRLSEDELASTLDRLDFDGPFVETIVGMAGSAALRQPHPIPSAVRCRAPPLLPFPACCAGVSNGQ